MALTRWEPFRELTTLHGELSRFSNQFWGAGQGSPTSDMAVWMPALDIEETDQAISLSLDVPGVAQDDISIELDGRKLTLSGERAREERDTEGSVRRYERRYGAFSRTVLLPAGVDVSQITADHEDGVLTVTVPKPEESKPKRIEIGVAQ